jgi:hypothetical protein
MVAAALGHLAPVAGALTQEAIDVAVILNALRALGPGWRIGGATIPSGTLRTLDRDHRDLSVTLDRLRRIADDLDDVSPVQAIPLIREAASLVATEIVQHERTDESIVYPRLIRVLGDGHGLGAMSRAHREIMHLARLLGRIASGLDAGDVDRMMVRDAQRVIEHVEALVRLHNAQEDDIYEHAGRSRTT